MAAYINKERLLAKYENNRLVLYALGKAPMLDEALEFLHDCGILEAMIQDARLYDRRNPYKLDCYTGMSGATDYYLYEYITVGTIEGVRKKHKLLHISMCNKLNEGLNIFGPDFIAWLQSFEASTVMEVLNKPKNTVYPVEIPEDCHPAGRELYFPTDREIEIMHLFDRFREESGACLNGSVRHILLGNKDIPSTYSDRISQELRDIINNFTEEDWETVHTVVLCHYKREAGIWRRIRREEPEDTNEESLSNGFEEAPAEE